MRQVCSAVPLILLLWWAAAALPKAVAEDAAAGTCIEWDGQPSPCQDFVGLEGKQNNSWNAYIHPTWEALLAAVAPFANSNGLASIPEACQISSLDMACRTFVRPCVVDPATNGMLPMKPEEGCSLSKDVTNYDLVLIRSIGYSGLGLFLFLTFASLEWRKV
ncbi:hypothetical protein QOT17_005854 [Balamuthia mandrillaris]